MTLEEIETLLQMIVANDKRTIGKGDFALWSAAADAANWTFPEARRALIEFITHDPDSYLRPGHITERIAAARRAIAAAWERPQPPRELADDVQAEIAWIRAHRDEHLANGMRAWANGEHLPNPATEIENPTQGHIPAPRTATARQVIESMRAFTEKTKIQ